MNANMAFAVAALVGLLAGEIVFGSPAWATDESVVAPAFTAQFSAACAGGYHPDKQGNCQPNNPQPNLQPCPPGLLSAPSPGWPGYTCVPIPKGY